MNILKEILYYGLKTIKDIYKNIKGTETFDIEYKINSNGPTLSQWITYGNHLYRGPREIAEVIFFSKSKDIRKTIVDNNGVIINFPGIAEPEKVHQYIECDTIYPVIRFETVFERTSKDRILMIWEVQPDGRYWDDDGFGSDNSLEVCLYTHLDSNGNFTGPFRLYSINGRKENIDE